MGIESKGRIIVLLINYFATLENKSKKDYKKLKVNFVTWSL